MVVVWSQGLKGSVDVTFKAWSSVPPLWQEMSLSHGLCLSQEKQQATWESAGSHGLYQRFLSEPIRRSGSPIRSEGSHAPLFCKSKRCSGSCTQWSKADWELIEQSEMWKFYFGGLTINPNCGVNEKHGIAFSVCACFKCHSRCFTWPSGSLHKCPCTPECKIWTKQPEGVKKSIIFLILGSHKHIAGTVDALCKASLERAQSY